MAPSTLATPITTSPHRPELACMLAKQRRRALEVALNLSWN